MNLKEIIDVDKKINFKNIVLNSKDVKENDLFIPYGGAIDRNKYIEDALNKKCSYVITNKPYNNKKVIEVKDLDTKIIKLFNSYYNNILNDINLIGITGTDGKTTIASIMGDLLLSPTIGTNGFNILDKNEPLNNTTPSLDILFSLFNKALKRGFKNIIMEVSSEAYLTKRIGNLPFKIAIFSNITLDHLDKHKTFENYLNCKLELFKHSEIGIINRDSKYYKKFKEVSLQSFSYGFNRKSDLRILSYKLYFDKTKIKFKYLDKKYELKYPLLGKFNVYNVAACILTMLKLGLSIEDILKKFKNIKQVKGRMEILYNKNILVVLDYAHTTNATLNVLKFFKRFKRNIITVVGAAGGRYKEKRSEIGKIVLKYSKLVIFTMDDPRFENPNKIIKDMTFATKRKNYLKILNRKEAIFYALSKALDNDIILILGKGRDNYMLVREEKIPYSDYQTINNFLNL